MGYQLNYSIDEKKYSGNHKLNELSPLTVVCFWKWLIDSAVVVRKRTDEPTFSAQTNLLSVFYGRDTARIIWGIIASKIVSEPLD